MAPPPYLGHQTAGFQIALENPQEAVDEDYMRRKEMRNAKCFFHVNKVLNRKLTCTLHKWRGEVFGSRVGGAPELY